MDLSYEVGFAEHSLYEVLYTAGFRRIHVFGAREPCGEGIRVKLARILSRLSCAALTLAFHHFLIPPPKILDKSNSNCRKLLNRVA